MKCLSFIFLLLPVFLWAQPTSLPLNFSSYAIKLGVAKDESLALTTRTGEVGLAGSINNDWRRADVTKDKDALSTLLDQPNFFNKDTGFVSGFVAGGSGKYNIIYHTTNGGQNWQRVNFGQDGWIDVAVNLDNGEAWLSVAGSGIAYTADYGLSWKKLHNPEIKQRFTAIYFNNARQGIAGSLWDMIAYTPDNCETWTLLPTPLDQHKYGKTDKQSRPEFNRVAIYKDYFLAAQEDLVFYSRRDSINWVWLPDYSDFYTDADNSALYFKTNKGAYVQSGPGFTAAHVFEPRAAHYDAKCKNGSLFIAGQEKMIRLNADGGVVSIPFTNTAKAGIQPVNVGYTEKGDIGVLDNKVFQQNGYNGGWDYLFVFPLSLEKAKLSVLNGKQLLYDRGDDSLFYFNLTGELEKKFSKLALLTSFCKHGIKKLIFEQGSAGCFHHYANKLVYTNQDGSFGDGVEIDDGGTATCMPDNDQSIEERDVIAFVEKLPLLFDHRQKTSIQELAFTPEELEQCRKDIRAFQAALGNTKKQPTTSFTFNRNNLDFNRLLGLVDSVGSIDNETLSSYLMNLSEMWSTTSFWKKLELTNGDGEALTIANTYCEENAFHFPWTVYLNGYSVVTTNMEINRFIGTVYPAFLNGGRRVDVLHALVKRLY